MSKPTQNPFLIYPLQGKQIQDALRAARGYVECCTEPDGSDGATAALRHVDDALAIRFIHP